MKSGDAAMIFAARDLAPLGVHSTVFLPGDEETTSAGVPALLTLCGDTPFDLCIGGEPTSKERLGDCIKNGRRGRFAGTITLHGRAGHAAYADRTPNIIDQLPAVIAALHAPWNDAASGAVQTTLSITNLTTDSSALNVIPGSVTLSFDARTTPGRSLDDVEREIERRLTDTRVPYTLTVPKRTLSYMTDPNGAPDAPQATLVRCAQQAIKEVLGMDPVLTCDGGTSDARFLAALGVPTIEFGVPHGNMHGPDEFVELENIERLRQVYGALVRRYQGERAAFASR
jgi:succinyl-diaminopimelate desuccinylase